MTSVLARLGQPETRIALQTIWRSNKRKREEWVCRHCHARRVQWRGYSDDNLRLTVGDYVFPPKEERKDDGDESRVTRAWGGRERGRPQFRQRGTTNTDTDGYGVRQSLKVTATADESAEWPLEDTRDNDPAAMHESAQNSLWEGFEQIDDARAIDASEALSASQADAGPLAASESDKSPDLHQDRDSSLLDMDYAATLPDALAPGEVDLTARCLFAAAKAQDRNFVRSLPQETFSDVLRILEPANCIDKLASAHLEISEATRELFGIASMRKVAYEYSQLVSEVVALRRSAGVRLTLTDYTVLLRGARDLGNRHLSAAIWKKLEVDGHTPDTECYNYYMAGKVFHDAHNATGRQKLRVISHNMLARKSSRLGARYQAFRVGKNGLKDQVMTIFREMLSNGATADEESFRIVITAAAREGEMSTIKSVLRKVWDVDVDAVLANTPETDIAPKQLPQTSPLYPTPKLLFTIAHAFGINNDIPAALRLVDFVARHYNLTVSQETWAHLFEWTFVLAVPRSGVQSRTNGTKTGQLPLQSVMSLWDTMTSAPYFIKPTMGMYNHLIKNLFYRDMSQAIIGKMTAGRHHYRRSLLDARRRWNLLQQSIVLSKHEPIASTSLEILRRDWEYADLIRKRNLFWCKRWLRLLLGSLRWRMNAEASGDLAHRAIPRLLREWAIFAPKQIRYETMTGRIEFAIRTQEEIDRSMVQRKKTIAEKESSLSSVPRYVGNHWARTWRPSDATKRVEGQHEPSDAVAGSTTVEHDWPDAERAEGVDVDHDEPGDEDTKRLLAEAQDAVRRALDVR